jgi:hypothetical protein
MIRSESVTALSAFVQSFSSSALRRAVLFFSLLLACTSVGTAQELPDFVKGTEADPLLERLKSDRQGLAPLTVEAPGLERAAAAPVPFTTSITDHEETGGHRDDREQSGTARMPHSPPSGTSPIPWCRSLHEPLTTARRSGARRSTC